MGALVFTSDNPPSEKSSDQGNSEVELTQLFVSWRTGNQEALDQLTPILYSELHSIARRFMDRERSGHTLQATALVHEAFLKLFDGQGIEVNDRVHFYAIAARVMRRILVDHARARHAKKRGGNLQRVPLDQVQLSATEEPADLISLDEALKSLERIDAQRARIIELRYFGGLSIQETAEVLELKDHRVYSESELALAWLHRELSRG